jgi:uncharacterized Zn finger protein
MSSLVRLITEPTLRRLAGERSYERGVGYFHSGAVERLTAGKDGVRAR